MTFRTLDTNLPLLDEIEAALVKAGAVCERFPDEIGLLTPSRWPREFCERGTSRTSPARSNLEVT